MKIKRALRVWQRHLTVYTKLYKSSFALNFAEPILYLTAMGLGLGAFVTQINGMPYINFIAPGIIASSSMFAVIYECTYGTYVRIVFQKTFDAILATPVNIDDLIAGEMIWGATKSILYGTTIIIVISLFGLVASPLIVLVIPLLFISGLIFAEISLVFVAVVPGIENKCQPNLAAVVDAAHRERLFFGFRQSRQQQRSQDGDDGDDHQQLNQGKARPLPRLASCHDGGFLI